MELKGNPVSKGVAIGEVFCYRPFEPDVKATEIKKEEVESQLKKYEQVKQLACEELESIKRKLTPTAPDKAKIFEAHIDILGDESIDEMVQEYVEEELMSAEYAILLSYNKFIKLLSKTKDELIKERVADLTDVRNRLLRLWLGKKEENLSLLDKPVIIAAHDLLPSDTATLDRSKVLAIVTEIGGATSHSAIIARSYEIPALLGVENVMEQLADDETVIVDALDGILYTAPSEELLAKYAEKREQHLKKAADTKKFLGIEPVTSDGVRVQLGVNIGSSAKSELDSQKYVDLVGLFRTEFLYMGSEQLPNEQKQFEVYKDILTAFGDRPVTLRTLDVGGDKTLPALPLPHEDNPFLGKRALRLCFDRLDIFRTQLRAAYRASVYGNLWIMLPMVGSLDDVRKAKEIIASVKSELDSEGIAYSKDVKVGIMIEIPSIALIADLAAQEVDFASIGTNDLCQYTTAVDRLNPSVVKYYQSYHPALFRLIGYAVSEFNKAGKPICVCGELGGDPLAAPVLVGLGMRKLSMSFSNVAEIKKVLSRLTVPQMEELAHSAVSLPTAGDVEGYLREKLEKVI